MALTRKFLKGMGLTDEQVDTIVEAHTETTEALKTDISKYKADADKLAEVQSELDALKADGWKEKHDSLKREFDGYKAEQTAKETNTKKEQAYRALLKEAGVDEKRIEAVMRVTKLEDIELDGDKIKDAAKVTEGVKTEWADFIGTGGGMRVDTGGQLGSGGDKGSGANGLMNSLIRGAVK